MKIYQNSIISLNNHTEAQLKYNILLNARVFNSSLQGEESKYVVQFSKRVH